MNIEIGQYKEINKGALRASFSLKVGEFIFLKCKYFVTGTNRFWTFPAEEMKGIPPEKSKFFPMIKMPNNEAKKALEDAVLSKFKAMEEGYDQEEPARAVQSVPSLHAANFPF